MDRFASGRGGRGSAVSKAVAWAVPLGVLVAALVASCGADRPPGAAGDGLVNVAPYCGTPNEGCECTTPGAIAECGKVQQVSGSYVSCSMGYRQCVSGHWGACVGSDVVTTKSVDLAASITRSGDVHSLGLGN